METNGYIFVYFVISYYNISQEKVRLPTIYLGR